MNAPLNAKSASNSFAQDLLAWYDRHARSMPWRVMPATRKNGVRPDPYQVWLSEVMLQQTQVATVGDYFRKFMAKWPTVEDLASAPAEDVMKAWAGLGYYSRARNLKKCAEMVAFGHGGRFPVSAAELQELPGIGPYTAAAIASIAFDEPVAVVDGNIERVITRQFRIEKPVRISKPEIRARVQSLLPRDRPGDFAQAMMDLGATLCSVRNPACGLCPVKGGCEAHARGDMERFPAKPPRVHKPTRKGAAFVIVNEAGEIYLRKRPDKGLLGGMSEVPGTRWNAREDGATGEAALPFGGQWTRAGMARHTFTHFHLELEVWLARMPPAPAVEAWPDGWWCAAHTVSGEALPTLMRKVIATALPDGSKSPPPE